MSNFQIIRTLEELYALDMDTVLIDNRNILETWGSWLGSSSKAYPPDAQFLPAVVVASGEQVRAAREAMEEEE